MNPSDIRRLLLVFAGMIFTIGVVMIVYFGNAVIGISQMGLAMALFAVAMTTGRRTNG